MKPAAFRYHDPRRRDELLALKSELGADALILAGGQSLMPMMNLRVVQAADVIDINHVQGLDGIEQRGDTLEIGALTRHRQAQDSALLARQCPLIGQALHYVGHPAIRTRGTLGGSLAHGDPAAELPAVMLALDAQVLAESRDRSRAIPASDLYDGPLSTTIREDEVLVGVRFGTPRAGTGSAVLEVSRRVGDFAMVGVACLVNLDDDGRMDGVRLAGFGVGPVPARLTRAEGVLRGERPVATVLTAATREAAREIPGIEDAHAGTAYRRHVTGVLVQRAVRGALEQARASGAAGGGD